FDTAELRHGYHSKTLPSIILAVLPIIVVIGVNFLMTLVILPRFDWSFLSKKEWGSTSITAVGGVWSVVTALATAIFVVIVINRTRFPKLRNTRDAGANASVLPALSLVSLVGFGAVIGSLPAFTTVRNWVLGLGGGPLISVAIATNLLAALTGSASGGLSI